MVVLLALTLLVSFSLIVFAVGLVMWEITRMSVSLFLASLDRCSAVPSSLSMVSATSLRRGRAPLALAATALCLLVIATFTEMVGAAGYGDALATLGQTRHRSTMADIEPNIKTLREGLAAASRNLDWGYVDRLGRVQIPFRYSSARAFCEGLAAVSKNNMWGFIDAEGREAIPFRYRLAADFREGKARVVLHDYSIALIDRSGDIIEIECPPPQCWGVLTSGPCVQLPYRTL